MKDKRRLLIGAVFGCAIILMVLIGVIVFAKPKKKIEPEVGVTVTPTVGLTATPVPTPTKKPDVVWDKPTGTPEDADIIVDPNKSDKPGNGGDSGQEGGKEESSTGKDKDKKEEVEIDTMGTGLNYDDYITVDKDGTIHINMDKYTEDINKKMEEK